MSVSIDGTGILSGVTTFTTDITHINSIGISTFSGGVNLGTGTTISSPASNEFSISTNGSERVRVDSVGRVGIATNIYPNNEMLVVDNANGSSAYNTKFVFSGTTNTSYCAATWTHGQSGTAIGYAGVGGSNTGNPSFRNTFVVGTQNATDLVLNTNDGEKLRVDSSGRVTMPYQVGFWYGSSTSNPSDGKFTNYGTVNTAPGYGNINCPTGSYNIGGHFNTSTGTFTAPVTGRYLVTATYANDTGVVKRSIGWLYYNGTNIGEWVESYGQYDNPSGVLVINMTANDYIQFATHTTIPFNTISAAVNLLY